MSVTTKSLPSRKLRTFTFQILDESNFIDWPEYWIKNKHKIDDAIVRVTVVVASEYQKTINPNEIRNAIYTNANPHYVYPVLVSILDYGVNKDEERSFQDMSQDLPVTSHLEEFVKTKRVNNPELVIAFGKSLIEELGL